MNDCLSCRIKHSISSTLFRTFLEGESEFHFAKAKLGRVKAAQCQRRNTYLLPGRTHEYYMNRATE